MSRIFVYFRSFHQRQLNKQKERLNYETYFKEHGIQNFKDLEYLLKRLLYFFELSRDGDILVRPKFKVLYSEQHKPLYNFKVS